MRKKWKIHRMIVKRHFRKIYISDLEKNRHSRQEQENTNKHKNKQEDYFRGKNDRLHLFDYTKWRQSENRINKRYTEKSSKGKNKEIKKN